MRFWNDPDVRAGFTVGLPLLGAVCPVAMVFGALSVQLGLTVADTVLMSAIVYAGASQMVAIDLWGQNVPAWSILLAVFAVNFRHLLYSAALTPIIQTQRWFTKAFVFFFLVDPQFAFTEQRAQEGHPFKLRWYAALASVFFFGWTIATLIGAMFGSLIKNPEALGLDMLLPLYFLALVMGFRARPRWALVVTVAGVVSVLIALGPELGILPAWLGPPWHVTIGGLAGVFAAALVPPHRPGSAAGNKAARNSGDRNGNAPPLDGAAAPQLRP